MYVWKGQKFEQSDLHAVDSAGNFKANVPYGQLRVNDNFNKSKCSLCDLGRNVFSFPLPFRVVLLDYLPHLGKPILWVWRKRADIKTDPNHQRLRDQDQHKGPGITPSSSLPYFPSTWQQPALLPHSCGNYPHLLPLPFPLSHSGIQVPGTCLSQGASRAAAASHCCARAGDSSEVSP